MSNDSLYDWDWSEDSNLDTIEQIDNMSAEPDERDWNTQPADEEIYEPDRPPDDEFYWAERLRLNNEKKNQDAGYLRVYEGPGQSRAINPDNVMDKAHAIANTSMVAKRSNGYQPTIGTVAQVPSIPAPALTNPYSKPIVTSTSVNSNGVAYEVRPPVPQIPNLVKASSIQRTSTPNPYYPPSPYPQQQVPVQQQYVPEPVQYQITPDISHVSYADIEAGVNQRPIPLPPKHTGRARDERPRLKVTRQLFLAILSLELADTRDIKQLEKLTRRMIECTIPESSNDNEICLYNADEVVRQFVVQIATTRDEAERIVLFKAAARILDMYVPVEVADKEYIRANNSSYPHPAYVGLQASLDLLNFIQIKAVHILKKNPDRKLPVAELINTYLSKYRRRLNRMPSTFGEGLDQTVMYYE